MPYPSNILLPSNAKFFGFVDTTNDYNAHWDITWSFQFCLSGSEHGICTFLTTNPSLTSAIPGHYLGYLGNYPYILTESGEYILDEDSERLTYEAPISGYDISGVLAIALDSTGFFALSDTNNSGISLADVKKNSLIIRSNNKLVFNAPLSSLSTDFILTTPNAFQTLRFRFANSNKVSIDYKNEYNEYILLTSVDVDFDPVAESTLYPSFVFCSPLSSSNKPPSNLKLKHFHTQGNLSDPTYDVEPFSPLITSDITNYTTISGISANPI